MGLSNPLSTVSFLTTAVGSESSVENGLKQSDLKKSAFHICYRLKSCTVSYRFRHGVEVFSHRFDALVYLVSVTYQIDPDVFEIVVPQASHLC